MYTVNFNKTVQEFKEGLISNSYDQIKNVSIDGHEDDKLMKDVCMDGKFNLKINNQLNFQVYPDYLSMMQHEMGLKNQIKEHETVPNSKNIMLN